MGLTRGQFSELAQVRGWGRAGLHWPRDLVGSPGDVIPGPGLPLQRHRQPLSWPLS